MFVRHSSTVIVHGKTNNTRPAIPDGKTAQQATLNGRHSQWPVTLRNFSGLTRQEDGPGRRAVSKGAGWGRGVGCMGGRSGGGGGVILRDGGREARAD